MKTFFDDVPPNMGWSYLSDQIFEMPRDQKYMSVLKKYQAEKAHHEHIEKMKQDAALRKF